MNKKAFPISDILRQNRELAHLTIEDVVTKLKDKNIDISSKTLYGYENGVSTPKVNTFLCLCDIYGIQDIMGTFGYASCVATANNEWPIDLYNDFFNTDLLGKIYILLKNGVPSFEGYEEKLEHSFPSNSEKANFNKLYSSFMKLTETGQGIAMERVRQLAEENFDYIKDEYKTPTSADAAG